MDKLAYINSQIACAMIEMEGMKIQNMMDMKDDWIPTYMKQDFDKLMEKYGLHHNAILTYLQE